MRLHECFSTHTHTHTTPRDNAVVVWLLRSTSRDLDGGGGLTPDLRLLRNTGTDDHGRWSGRSCCSYGRPRRAGLSSSSQYFMFCFCFLKVHYVVLGKTLQSDWFTCGGPCHLSNLKQCSGDVIFLWDQLVYSLTGKKKNLITSLIL